MFIQGVGTTDSGGNSFAISDDGEVVIQTTDSEVQARLGLPPAGLRVRMTGTGKRLHQPQRRNRDLYRFLCHRGRAGEYPEGRHASTSSASTRAKSEKKLPDKMSGSSF